MDGLGRLTNGRQPHTHTQSLPFSLLPFFSGKWYHLTLKFSKTMTIKKSSIELKFYEMVFSGTECMSKSHIRESIAWINSCNNIHVKGHCTYSTDWYAPPLPLLPLTRNVSQLCSHFPRPPMMHTLLNLPPHLSSSVKLFPFSFWMSQTPPSWVPPVGASVVNP